MRHRRPAAAARHRARAAKERSLTGPRFVGSFPAADAPLDPPLPEVALIGRSNVGKSSLVNALAGQRLARVSATPGKTRAFTVYAMAGPPRPHYLLDLPGYGYARASHAERAILDRIIAEALARARLAGVVWLLDIRRDPSTDDHAMHAHFARAGTRVLAAITKCDKLPRGQRLRRAALLQETLALESDQVIVTSTQSRHGIDELRESIAAFLQNQETA